MTDSPHPSGHRIVGVTIRTDRSHPKLRNVQPILDAKPSRGWGELFHSACAAEPTLDWTVDGFARCRQEDTYTVQQTLVHIAQETNRRDISSLDPRADPTPSTLPDDETAVNGYIFNGRDWT